MVHLSQAPPRAVKCKRESAWQPPCRRISTARRKVRAPQSGMQGNALARRRDEEGKRDESSSLKTRGVKGGNLHPEQHQIGKRSCGNPITIGRLGQSLRVGG